MNIAIIGTGYVGLVNGACLSFKGHNVICIDNDSEKINKLKKGIIPIFEPKLSEIVSDCLKNGNLKFSNNYSDIKSSDIVFICVGTPQSDDGSADLQYVINASKSCAKQIKDGCVVVIKSTVPVGSCEKVKQYISEELNNIERNVNFEVVSNPEFLREGSAVNDCLYADRIVVGVDNDNAKSKMTELYNGWNENTILFITDIKSSELIKYTSNAMLATRISLINEVANLCDAVGANIVDVSAGVGLDRRIGASFLNAGCGYGGSCFPKDVNALIKTAREYKCNMEILKSVHETNEHQKKVVYNKLCKLFDNKLKDKTVALFGLAFKPNTNDMREAPSLTVINYLIANGCRVKAYDQIAKNDCMAIIGNTIEYCDSIYEAATDADAIIVMTESDEFINANLKKLKKCMSGNVIIDGRNIYNKDTMTNLGFVYQGIGK